MRPRAPDVAGCSLPPVTGAAPGGLPNPCGPNGPGRRFQSVWSAGPQRVALRPPPLGVRPDAGAELLLGPLLPSTLRAGPAGAGLTDGRGAAAGLDRVGAGRACGADRAGGAGRVVLSGLADRDGRAREARSGSAVVLGAVRGGEAVGRGAGLVVRRSVADRVPGAGGVGRATVAGLLDSGGPACPDGRVRAERRGSAVDLGSGAGAVASGGVGVVGWRGEAVLVSGAAPGARRSLAPVRLSGSGSGGAYDRVRARRSRLTAPAVVRSVAGLRPGAPPRISGATAGDVVTGPVRESARRPAGCA